MKLIFPLVSCALISIIFNMLYVVDLFGSLGQYVYYLYIPPSLCNLSKIIRGSEVYGEIITIYNYTSFPSNLDIVGTEDGISYELYDLSTGELIKSGTLNKYQHVSLSFGSRRTDVKPFETEDFYLKLVTDKQYHPWPGEALYGAYRASTSHILQTTPLMASPHLYLA